MKHARPADKGQNGISSTFELKQGDAFTAAGHAARVSVLHIPQQRCSYATGLHNRYFSAK